MTDFVQADKHVLVDGVPATRRGCLRTGLVSSGQML